MRSELLGVEVPTTLTEDGLNIITHDTLRVSKAQYNVEAFNTHTADVRV
jgi:hypothetical protein